MRSCVYVSRVSVRPLRGCMSDVELERRGSSCNVYQHYPSGEVMCLAGIVLILGGEF